MSKSSYISQVDWRNQDNPSVKMTMARKIILIWAAIMGGYLACLWLFPHSPFVLSTFVNRSIQILLLCISLFLFRKEPNRKNRFIFLNFFGYYSLSVLWLVYDFLGGTFLSSHRYVQHLSYQYVVIGYALFLSVSIVYLVIDLLFRDFKVFQKYLVTFSIVFVLFGYYFHPFLTDPYYLYSTEDVKQLKALLAYTSRQREMPTTSEIANNVTLQSWSDGHATGDLYPEENLRRVEELAPYLESQNFLVVLWEPLYLKIISMHVFLVGFILLFFGYQYRKDPPQGAYVDKIMFALLILSSMEILHNWSFINSLEWGSFIEIVSVGEYVTVLAELMLVLFFVLRLRFITSVQGIYYESELASNPQQITRLRDWVDNMVLAHFFNFKIFNGRLFQGSSAKEASSTK